MSHSVERVRGVMNSARARRFTLAAALVAVAFSARAEDPTPSPSAGQLATARVETSLSEMIDATVTQRARADFDAVETQPRSTAAVAQDVERAETTTRAPDILPGASRIDGPSPARAAVEHTKVFIAIKDGARTGALVQ